MKRMKGSDRYVVIGLTLAAILAGFWFLAVSPQRKEASELKNQIGELQTSIDAQRQLTEFAKQARADFPRYYGKVVILGKAVPEQADTSSLLVQLSSVSGNSKLAFRSIKLSAGSASSVEAPPVAPAPTGTEPATTEAPGEPGSTATPPATAASETAAPAPPLATEAVAATLPIGSTIGPAGLPILPYELSFDGRFFDVASFFAGLDRLVHADGTRVSADGRLLTVDGFSLTASKGKGFPFLQANLAVSSYVTPSGQGLTAGATSAGPASTPISTGGTQ